MGREEALQEEYLMENVRMNAEESIILAPGLSGNELMESLALRGVDTINIRVMTAPELAQLALLKTGIIPAGRLVSLNEEPFLMGRAVDSASALPAVKEYFGNPTYNDLRQITSTIRDMRSLVTCPDEADEAAVIEATLRKGQFAKKNLALLAVYKSYLALLHNENLLDGIRLIRQALQDASRMGECLMSVKEYRLNPLEEALLNRLSHGEYAELSVVNLYRGKTEAPAPATSYARCYGAATEVGAVIDDIYRNHRADRCTIAVTDSSLYPQLLFDLRANHRVPLTFGTGIPITNSNPATLLRLLYSWQGEAYHSGEALRAVLESPALSRGALLGDLNIPDDLRAAFFDALYSLRLSEGPEANASALDGFQRSLERDIAIQGPECKANDKLDQLLACVPYLKKLAEKLEETPEEFVRKYSYIRRGEDKLITELDMEAIGVIHEYLTMGHRGGRSLREMVERALSVNVCVQKSDSASVHVTDVRGAMADMRPELYIPGLDAGTYPGSPRENHLLLDEDIRNFGEKAEYLTSDGLVLGKIETFRDVLRLAGSVGSRVHLSYSELNASELKAANPSSVYLEALRKSRSTEQRVGYFDADLAHSRKIGRAYDEGSLTYTAAAAGKAPAAVDCLSPDKAYSPTAIDLYYQCPKAFMLKYIIGLPDQEETDPLEVLPANDKGTLAHALMERLSAGVSGRDEFMKYAEEMLEDYLLRHPAAMPSKINGVKRDFLDMMGKAYDTDPGNAVVLSETRLAGSCAGVGLAGYPDRIEEGGPEGGCIVVDYKTGGTIRHKEDEVDSCLQALIYAYLFEQDSENGGRRVSRVEYRYLALGKTVSCRYDDEIRKAVEERIGVIGKALAGGAFPCTPGEKDVNCTYCKYGRICGKNR